METVNQSGTWNNLGIHGSLVVIWWLCISSRVKPENFDFLSHIWPSRSRSIPPPPKKKKNKKNKTGILTKVFCTSGPNLVILAWMGGELWCGQAQIGVNLDIDTQTDRQTHTHTDAGNDNTRRPKLASGKNKNGKLTKLCYWCLYFVRKQTSSCVLPITI